MKRNAAVAAAAAAGVAAGALLAHIRRRLTGAPAGNGDPRAEELRRKLDEAKRAPAKEEDFQAAGMGPETIVEEPPELAAPRRGAGDGVEATRKRVHEEGRAAAKEMRGDSEPGDP